MRSPWRSMIARFSGTSTPVVSRTEVRSSKTISQPARPSQHAKHISGIGYRLPGKVYAGRNFGLVRIDWAGQDTTITLTNEPPKRGAGPFER